MSIYHRYALYHNCRRYLDEVEKVKEITAEYAITDENPDSGLERNSLFPTSSTGSDYESTAGSRKFPKEDTRYESQDAGSSRGNRKETGCETSRIRDDECDCGSEPDCTSPAGCTQGTDAEEMDTDNASEVDANSMNGNWDSTCSRCSSNSARHPVLFHSDKCTIRKPQMDHFLMFSRTLQRIVAALLDNIRRIQSTEDGLAAALISHFWREAARLNGTEPLKSPRALQKEFESLDWWSDGDERRGEDVETVTGASVSSFGANYMQKKGLRQHHSSPLFTVSSPDDLIWEEQVRDWQLDLGRALDEKGRRHLKI